MTDHVRPLVFLSYKHGDHDALIRDVVGELDALGVGTYLDRDWKPTEDPDGLAVGLSLGLTICPVLAAFVSEAYLDSPWCRQELREFIYLHGRRLEEREFHTWASAPLEIHREQAGDDLPLIPAIIVMLEDRDTRVAIAKAVMPANRLEDTNRRIDIIRGAGGTEGDEDSVKYMRERGIDASAYVPSLTVISGAGRTPRSIAVGLADGARRLLGSRFAQGRFPQADRCPKGLWRHIWQSHASDTPAGDLPSETVLKKLELLPASVKTAGVDHAEESSPLILHLLEAIAHGQTYIEFFDRRQTRLRSIVSATDLVSALPVVPESLQDFFRAIDELRRQVVRQEIKPQRRSGDPVDVLLEDARTFDIIKPLQATFYRYLSRHGPIDAVALVVTGCLLINIDVGFEKVTSVADITDMVLSPLSKQRDIRAMFPGPFLTTERALELQELQNLHTEIVVRQRDTRRRQELLWRVEKPDSKS